LQACKGQNLSGADLGVRLRLGQPRLQLSGARVGLPQLLLQSIHMLVALLRT
jgi:hypothetical protein